MEQVPTESSEDSERVKIRKLPTGVILLVELCERLTYYTLAGTQKIYLQNQLLRSPSTSAAMTSVFSMLCYFWCIPGGLLADSIGRYKTIVGFGCIYALGTLLVACAVFDGVQRELGWLFMIGCFGLIALGTGGIKPNISNFGADQIGDATERQRECQKTFFSLLYLSINIGVLISFGFLTNITTGGLPGVIPEADGYSFAYGMGAICMMIAVVLFVAFTRFYQRLPGNGTGPFQQMLWYHWHSVKSGGGWKAAMSAVGFACLPLFFLATLASTLWPESQGPMESQRLYDPCSGSLEPPRSLHGVESGKDILTQIALILGSIACVFLVVANVNCSWVQELEAKEDGSEDEKSSMKRFSAEEAKQTFAAVPVIVVVNLAFNLCYNSMNAAFPSQACQMDLRVGGKQLNGAFFNIADAVVIVVFTLICESCLYPLMARLSGRKSVSLTQKIILGLVIAAASNLAAAVLEIQRRQAPFLCNAGFSECAPGYADDGLHGTRMNDISAFWTFIPFAMVGIAEVLINPCMYCYSYESAPVEVRSLLQAFNLFFQGSVSNAFTAVVAKLAYPNNLNKGHLEYYYYVNAACSVVGIGLYLIVTGCGRESQREQTKDPATE